MEKASKQDRKLLLQMLPDGPFLPSSLGSRQFKSEFEFINNFILANALHLDELNWCFAKPGVWGEGGSEMMLRRTQIVD